MAFNFGFPATYQQPYNPQINQPLMQPQSNNSIIWVQGEAGAKAYPVAPGNSLVLMDSESECFYIKSTDISGVPMPLRAFTYSEIKSDNVPHETSNFVSRDEFNELKQFVNSKLNNNRKEKQDEQIIPRNTGKQHNRQVQ